MTGEDVNVNNDDGDGAFQYRARVSRSARRSLDRTTVWVSPNEREMTRPQLERLLKVMTRRNAIDWEAYSERVLGTISKKPGAARAQLVPLLNTKMEHNMIDWTQFGTKDLRAVAAELPPVPAQDADLQPTCVPPPPIPDEYLDKQRAQYMHSGVGGLLELVAVLKRSTMAGSYIFTIYQPSTRRVCETVQEKLRATTPLQQYQHDQQKRQRDDRVAAECQAQRVAAERQAREARKREERERQERVQQQREKRRGQFPAEHIDKQRWQYEHSDGELEVVAVVKKYANNPWGNNVVDVFVPSLGRLRKVAFLKLTGATPLQLQQQRQQQQARERAVRAAAPECLASKFTEGLLYAYKLMRSILLLITCANMTLLGPLNTP